MIDKIEENQTVKDYTSNGTQRIRLINNIEKEIISKINELVDKFNEVFPL